MIGTISPLVQGDRNQWWRSTVLYLAGSILGGAMLFGGVAYLGQRLLAGIDPSARWIAASGLATVTALTEFGLIRIPLPKINRSVPQWWWFDFGPNQAAFAYGLVLGVGITTVVPFATFYLAAAWALLAADAGYGLLLGTAYGFARALPVLAVSVAMVPYPEREQAFRAGNNMSLRINGGRRTAHALNGFAAAGFAAAAVSAGVLAAW